MSKSDKTVKGSAEAMRLVAIDDGFADTKGATDCGVEAKIASIGCGGTFGSALGGEDLGAYETENRRFTVGRNVDAEETRFEGYATSPLNRVIVHHMLRQLGLGGQNIKLASSLPVLHYFNPDGTPNENRIAAKRKNLAVPVKALAGSPCAVIVENIVFPEALSAYVDFAVDESGNVSSEISGPVAIADIGGNTTDTAVLLQGSENEPPRIDFKRCGTDTIGVMNVYQRVKQSILQKFELDSISQAAVRSAVATSKITLFGEETDVADIVNSAIEQVGVQILDAVGRRIGKAGDLHKVIFVGGGALVFRSVVETFRHGFVPQNPDMCNARGMIKYLKFFV